MHFEQRISRLLTSRDLSAGSIRICWLPQTNRRALFFHYQGFSLMEFIGVIIIIGILSSVYFLKDTENTKNTLSAVGISEQLASDIRCIQTYAMSRNQILQMHFNQNGYQLTDDAQQPVIFPMNMTPVALPNEFQIVTNGLNNNTLVFHSNGAPAHTALAQIFIQKNQNILKTVQIQAQTGMVDIP